MGATTLIIPEPHIKFPASLSSLLEKEKPTMLTAVPLIYMNLLDYGVLADRNLGSLRQVLYSGEPFPAKHLKKLMTYWPQATFTNSYGPTELSHCTYYNLKEPPTENDSIPIGKVWAETSMLIVDGNDNIVEKTEAGELLVHSSTLMKGYWNQPELTEKVFFSGADGKYYYRTGDLVKLDINGDLIFLGRKDRQVKIRGYRIELDEIEVILLRHPAVKEVAVFSIQSDDENLVIESIASIKDGHNLSEDDLSSHITKFLPRYFLPQKITLVKEIPRNANGKVDYSFLSKDTKQPTQT
ncbi:MAG: AMP-binding protein [Bacteroidetes bacterium]|nr:AMP-binding protein [Bacteroidota bacterium]